MICTTLCYIENGGKYLMLHRCKHKDGGKDVNDGKWIGVGGHVNDGESPVECVKREILEETGLEIDRPRFRGVVTFVPDTAPSELMFLFTAETDRTDVSECDEGVLRWIPKDEIGSLALWEGDRIFLDYLKKDVPPFLLKLNYVGDKLVSYESDVGQ
ncbi:MAG: 8-oxo-dGTP diphosphatase [Clostridia bacterium]|nr:8-oxo-dGTP diphosphatase [Clostridia bacterium]